MFQPQDHHEALAALASLLMRQYKLTPDELHAINKLSQALAPWDNPNPLAEALNSRLEPCGYHVFVATNARQVRAMQWLPQMFEGFVLGVMLRNDHRGAPARRLKAMYLAPCYAFGPVTWWRPVRPQNPTIMTAHLPRDPQEGDPFSEILADTIGP